MPVSLAASAVAYGAAQGLFPIGWVVFSAILLYNITVATGQFDTVRASVANLTGDRRLQALLIAFAFGAFIEGAAGFGTPVAVAAAMLTGLGFKPFRAATICLLANTAPVAFGSIGTPLIMLATVTGLPVAATQRGRWPHLRAGFADRPGLPDPGDGRLEGVARRAAGRVAVRNFFRRDAVSGIELYWRGADGYSGIADCGGRLVDAAARVEPKDDFHLEGDGPAHPRTEIPVGQILSAWTPFALLVICVLVWGLKPVQAQLGHASLKFPWPGLHRLVTRMPPVVVADAL